MSLHDMASGRFLGARESLKLAVRSVKIKAGLIQMHAHLILLKHVSPHPSLVVRWFTGLS